MSNSGRSRKGKKDKRQQRAVVVRNVAPRITQIPNLGLVHNCRLRFTSTATAAVSITFYNLLDTMIIASTATAGWQLFDVVRVRAVEVWAYTSGATVSTTVSFPNQTSGVSGDNHTVTDTSMGVQPAYIKAVPAKRSAASLYQSYNAGVAFVLYCPAASVVDVHLTMRTGLEGGSPTGAAAALVGATAGLIYLRGLDGAATAGTKFAPQGSPQVI